MRFLPLSVCIFSVLVSLGQMPMDTTHAKELLDEAKKNFAQPKKADSLAFLGFRYAGNFSPMKGEAAFIICFAQARHDFKRAEQWGDSALHYFQLDNNYRWIGLTNRVLGVQACQQNKNELGLQYLHKATSFFEKCRDTVMLMENYVSYSLLYHNNIQDFKTGLAYGLKGFEWLDKVKDVSSSLRWRVINAVAINYDDAHAWDKALEYHYKNIEAPSLNNRSTTLNNIGNTLRKKGDILEAEKYFKRSLALIDDNAYDFATVYLNLAQVSLDLKKLKAALAYNDSSLKYAAQSENLEKLRDGHDFASELFQSQGQYQKAYQHLKSFMELKDSVLNKQKAEIIYDLEWRYETERKERQIDQLKTETLTKDLSLQRNRILFWLIGVSVLLAAGLVYWYFKRHQYQQQLQRAAEADQLQRQRFSAVIEAEENERARVAKDLHDGLGQLLSTAKLGLTAVSPPQDMAQAQLLKNTVDVLNHAANEVRSISHNLMPAALTELGLCEALDDMAHKINNSNLLHIDLKVQGLEERLPSSVEVAIYRVVQEVVNNMIKHAKADKIHIQVNRINANLQLSISDNGVGFQKELITKSQGLGWKNIFSRIAMLNGNIEVDTNPGAGTSISIQFAIA